MMVGATLRNLDIQTFENLTPGQIVDYCIEYNNTVSMKESDDTEREATQEDFNKF